MRDGAPLRYYSGVLSSTGLDIAKALDYEQNVWSTIADSMGLRGALMVTAGLPTADSVQLL